MKRTELIAAIAALVISAAPSFGQSKSFKLGQWVEIQNAILKELNKSYVDSLPIDRIEKAGINAMLESLDPYTIYVPEEDNDDFEFMIDTDSSGSIGMPTSSPTSRTAISCIPTSPCPMQSGRFMRKSLTSPFR